MRIEVHRSCVALSASLILVLSACQLDRAEKAAPGQPTMNELMHRRADASRQQQEKEKAMMERARTLKPDAAAAKARELLDLAARHPGDTLT